ncbi:hypothetical protein [Apilactobacillus xinyiensis]|uniref:hypothetical protein n=1 Tax=Apilactobacillus xinyiensis TaxID=2841032 RepID=UPI003364D00B
MKNDYLTIVKGLDDSQFAAVRDFFNRSKTKKPAISGQDNGLNKNINTLSIQQKEAE